MAGLFVAIEGGDGSGKSTQADLLATHLEQTGKKIHRQKFPRYGNDSAYYIEQYLNGRYGQTNDVPADLGVLPYALDRYAASKDIRLLLEENSSVIICDRYMGSNLAHQGAKIDDKAVRHEFYRRTQMTEYDVLGIPKATINIVLIMPTHLAQANVDNRTERSYTTHTRDIHEADHSHLESAKRNYIELCALYPDEFKAVQCTNTGGELRTIADIQDDIRAIVSSYLS